MLLKIPFGPWDIARQIRRLSMYTHSRLQSKSNDWRDIYILNSVCSITDLDENNHMNNARYLREADMARQNMWFHNGVTDAMYARKTKNPDKRIGFVLASSTIRYRHEISCFTKLQILTRILGWDSKTFYVECIFVSKDSNNKTIIHAYMVGCQQPVGVTPQELMADIGYKGASPTLPQHVQLWQKSEAVSRSTIPKDEKQLQQWLKQYGGYNTSNDNTSSATTASSNKPDPIQYHSQLAVVTTGTEPPIKTSQSNVNQTSSSTATPVVEGQSRQQADTVNEYDFGDDSVGPSASAANIELELQLTSTL